MSDLFSIYEDSLNIILRNIQKIMDSMTHLSKEKTENALNEAHNDLKEADSVLRQLELEAESESSSSKPMSNIVLSKLRYHQNEVEAAKKQFLRLQEDYVNKKSQDALMIIEDDSTNREAQRRQLIQSEEGFDQIEQNGNSNKAENENTQRDDEVFNVSRIPLFTQLNRKISKSCLVVGLILFFVIVISIALCFICL